MHNNKKSKLNAMKLKEDSRGSMFHVRSPKCIFLEMERKGFMQFY